MLARVFSIKVRGSNGTHDADAAGAGIDGVFDRQDIAENGSWPGRPCASLTRTNGWEVHAADAGTSSIVWHADRPSAAGSSRIRSWDVPQANATDPEAEESRSLGRARIARRQAGVQIGHLRGSVMSWSTGEVGGASGSRRRSGHAKGMLKIRGWIFDTPRLPRAAAVGQDRLRHSRPFPCGRGSRQTSRAARSARSARDCARSS
jgi:hypothetical protein